MDKNELGASTSAHVRGQAHVVEDQMVGVRRMVRSCHTCDSWSNNLENYCPGIILIY
ncbi:hypothetical protein Peur_072275 [Populus x canadensis]